MSGLNVYVGPAKVASLQDAVTSAGGQLTPLADAEAIVYFGNDDPQELADMLHPGIKWVQLPHAGIEPWQQAGLLTRGPIFSCSSGAYGYAVAEHALAFMLGAARSLHADARTHTWGPKNTRMFSGSTVALIGAGGIGRNLIRLLAPFNVRILAVSDVAVPGAEVTVPPADYRTLLPQADYVVIGVPYVPATHQMISTAEFALMKTDAWLINVARGPIVDTEALVAALGSGAIGGAAMDVTDPEPLPDGHPLWTLPNALISPHCANPDSEYWAGLNQRTHDNVVAYLKAGGPVGLAGLVAADRGF